MLTDGELACDRCRKVFDATDQPVVRIEYTQAKTLTRTEWAPGLEHHFHPGCAPALSERWRIPKPS